jgi:predicted choloylglycine hydrolase
MYRTRSRVFALIALAAFVLMPAAAPAPASELQYRERVVAGGPDDYMEVRHVYMKGANFEIGRKIGEIAASFGARPGPRGDALLNGAQREYIEENYPILYERMRGLAAAFDLGIDDDRYDFSSVYQFPMGPPGCSAVFYPGASTASGHGIMSRNYDFTTGTITGRHPTEDQPATMSRPLIFEIHPDRGYASIAVCAFDLLGGVLDGMNEKGLVVAIFGDDDTANRYGVHPSSGVGLHELMSMRYLLDTCADVAEAKKALLTAKHIYGFIPCHYLIADRSGRSFIFEFSPYRHETYIVDGDGPQCITNHLVSKYPRIEEFPDTVTTNSFDRYRTLAEAVAEKERFTLDEIDYAPNRTLWYAVYDASDSSFRARFYLGDRRDPANEGKKIVEYSDFVELTLEPR